MGAGKYVYLYTCMLGFSDWLVPRCMGLVYCPTLATPFWAFNCLLVLLRAWEHLNSIYGQSNHREVHSNTKRQNRWHTHGDHPKCSRTFSASEKKKALIPQLAVAVSKVLQSHHSIVVSLNSIPTIFWSPFQTFSSMMFVKMHCPDTVGGRDHATSWYGDYPIISGIFKHLRWLAGFQPSTVLSRNMFIKRCLERQASCFFRQLYP